MVTVRLGEFLGGVAVGWCGDVGMLVVVVVLVVVVYAGGGGGVGEER